jgi:antitoxin component HigA of HigAB toxin-antitoxin module
MVITTPEEHEAALKEILALMDSLPDMPLEHLNPPQRAEAARLNELADAIEAYEKIHYPFEE